MRRSLKAYLVHTAHIRTRFGRAKGEEHHSRIIDSGNCTFNIIAVEAPRERRNTADISHDLSSCHSGTITEIRVLQQSLPTANNVQTKLRGGLEPTV